jgi:hypothetical protein
VTINNIRCVTLRELLNKKRDELFEERRYLKFDPISLDEIARIEFEAGANAMLELLMPVVEAAEDAIVQIKDQKVIWPAEVDDLSDALTTLRERLK